jgi:hypothetical protein
MNPAQVLAVEIKQYLGQGLRTLVPRVIGQTAIKNSPIPLIEKRYWDESSFMEEIKVKKGDDAAKVASIILEWATAKEMPIRWGIGRIDGSCIPKIHHKGRNRTFFKVWTNATIEILAYESPFNLQEKKAELLNRFQSAVGTSIVVNLYCWYIPFSALNDEIVLKDLLQVLEWAINEIQSS